MRRQQVSRCPAEPTSGTSAPAPCGVHVGIKRGDLAVGVSIIVGHRSSRRSWRWHIIIHALKVVCSWYDYWWKVVLGGERGRNPARTGRVQRLGLGNRGVVVIVVEPIVRTIEGGVELVVGMARGLLCGQGSISSGHGDCEGARVSLLAVRHFRG